MWLPNIVPAGSRTEALTGKPHSLVTSETGLDISEFNFNFDQLGFFAPPHSEHLSHPALLSDNLHAQPVQQTGGFINSWEHHHLPTTSDTFPVIDHTQPQPQPQAQHTLSQPQTELHRSPQIPSSSSPVAFRGRACQPKPVTDNSVNSNKRPRFRYGQSPGHISFLDTSSLRQLQESNSSPTTTWEASPVLWMAELNEINVRLLELSTALSEAQEAPQPLGRPSNERFRENGWPIDEMFNLTQRVADILDQLAATATERRASADPGNSMFVLSTYVRLLDMYQKVFGLVQTEVAQTDPDELLIIASEVVFQFWKLPNVNIGSIPVNSTPSLAMFLTAQLANNFLRRLRKATAALDASLRNPKDGTVNGQAGAGTLSTSLFVDVSYEMVKSREETLTKHLAELRKELASIIPMLDCYEEEEEEE
ncbi:unnamed protein product [Clonostachys solani]|uniref:Uncharacterized protein n=1 Tax=Clonostachys solani TaxID=160281 RepID=A0A9N9Z3W7_9HYPO|nr:unnamed protein product [Clonostachys solani]